MIPKFYGQHGQDKYLFYKVFPNKKNGTFLDIGAFDGIALSNTYTFERDFGWKGVCVEPNPDVFDLLRKNRPFSTCINGAAYRFSSVGLYRKANGPAMLGGLVKHMSEEHTSRIHRECGNKDDFVDIPTRCYNINYLLSLAAGEFKRIDILSIDTEGSEQQIVAGINFSEFDIQTIVIESNENNKELLEFIRKKGYNDVKRTTDDFIFVKK